jgi:hypothetical protein
MATSTGRYRILFDMGLNSERDQIRANQLIDEIAAAFATVARGDGMTLHQTEAIDDYATEEEQLAARNKDKEQKWQDVPGQAIEACTTAFCYLDEKGFHYYLPAYMTWILQNLRLKGGEESSTLLP